MRSTVTVSIRSLVFTAGVAIAIVAAYAVGSAQSGGSPAFAAEGSASSDAPSIVMTGSGEATGVPDQLVFSLTVQTSASDVSAALRSANTATRNVLRAVSGQGVARKDVQTTGLSISPVYDYSGNGPPVITGYSVSESLSVLVRSLPDAGSVIGTAVKAGGNAVRLHDLRLQIGDEDALLRQAREDAFAQAKAKAEQYAAASGRQLGEVISVREVHSSRNLDRLALPAVFDAQAMSHVPIRAGSANLKVTVSVVWSFA
jgi:uncharacterized protein YggE